MREAREEMLRSLNENNLEKMRKAAGGAKQTLKMKDGSIGVDSFTASAIMQIYDMINDKNKKTFENMMNNGKKADIMKLAKFAMSKVNAEYVPEEFEEEFELDEAPLAKQSHRAFGYELYHKDFSSAMQHAYKMAKKNYGITVDPKEIDDKVVMGPRKPSEGKTNTYRLKGDKGAIQVQVYNKGGSKPFELNMYKEEVELDEAKQKPYVSSDRDGKHVMNASGEIAKSFKDMDSANAYLKKNYNKLMKEKLDTEDEPIVKAVVKMLKKASNAHAGQAKDLEKAVKEDSENEGFASDAQRRAAFASGYKEKGKKKDESAASDARRAMASDPSTKQKFSKNVSATDDDVKAADKNIIMQMRKAVSLRGNKVEFMDKKKVMIPQKIAQAVITKYNNMKKPTDKEKFQSKISKSYKSMLATLKERNEINNKNNSLDQLKELVKEMKGKNNG